MGPATGGEEGQRRTLNRNTIDATNAPAKASAVVIVTATAHARRRRSSRCACPRSRRRMWLKCGDREAGWPSHSRNHTASTSSTWGLKESGAQWPLSKGRRAHAFTTSPTNRHR